MADHPKDPPADPTSAPDTLIPEEVDLVAWAAARTNMLYDGKAVAHRSCGIALAETYGLATAPYQSLRRGGITGHGQCGAIKAGELILGEVFGDPDPRGPVTDKLKKAMHRYRALWQAALAPKVGDSIVCNDLTARFDDFRGHPRHAFCTSLAETASACVARTILEMGGRVEPTPEPER